MAKVDPMFGLDNFGKQKELSESETLVFNILMVLFNKPGFIPSIPELGMNIPDLLYSLEGDLDTESLKNQLVYQCSDFLDTIEDGSFDIRAVTQDGQTFLLFILPVIVTNEYKNLLIGIGMTSIGELIYNYTFNEIQSL